MEGIDKLDIMCSKPPLRSRRGYINLWLHSFTIAVVNSWFLYHRKRQWSEPQEKTMLLLTF